MAKTAAERQRERRAKLRENGEYDQYKKKAAEQKKTFRQKKLSIESEVEKKIRQEKDRINHIKHRLKQKEKKNHHMTIPCKAFGNNQALGKAISRAKIYLPNSPSKRIAVVQKLASQYSPKLPFKTTRVYNNGIDEATKEAVINFYANDNISSQAPGLRDFFILRNDTEMEEKDGTTNILEFLMLVGKLKHLKRTGWVRRNIPECETVAGHMYRMSIMAFLLDSSTLPNINKNRCIKMALVHDIAECIVGDITPFCGVSKEEKQRREIAAMDKLCSLVGKKHGTEIFELFMEYENQETMEAKAVKDLDKFDMILQAFEYEKDMKKPNFLQGFFDNTEGTFQNPLISKWVEELKTHRQEAHKNMDIKSENVDNV